MGKKYFTRIFAEVCTWIKSSVRHKILSNCSAILIAFYHTILSTINIEVILIIMINNNNNNNNNNSNNNNNFVSHNC